MKVLTVDDSRTIRLLVRQALAPLEFDEILEAENGEVALGKVAETRVDLVILDVTMPVMDGPTTLRRLRDSHPEVPVIMLTAEAEKATVVEILKLGVSSYLLKPFQADQLVTEVRKVLLLGDGESATDHSGASEDDDKPVVMVVDDKETVLESAEKLLSPLARVITTTNASEAVDLASKYAPKLIFLDLVIPGVDVLELFSILRVQARLKETRFLAMAIRTMVDEIQQARKKGFDGLLMKPFTEETIQQVFKRNLQGSEALVDYGPGYATLRFPASGDYEGLGQAVVSQQTQKKVTEAFYEVADSACSRLLLDLSNLTSSDASLFTCLTSLQTNAQELGISLGMVVPQNGLARTLGDLSETSKTPIYRTLEEATTDLPKAEEATAS
jgi:CheY-like chemotaxis protein/anti-anti-sigma regulatory factor